MICTSNFREALISATEPDFELAAEPAAKPDFQPASGTFSVTALKPLFLVIRLSIKEEWLLTIQDVAQEN